MGEVASYVGLSSILFLVIGLVLWLQLVQSAFEDQGFIWGLWSIFFPVGTYKFCKLKWEAYGGSFWKVSACLGVSIFLYIFSKVM